MTGPEQKLCDWKREGDRIVCVHRNCGRSARWKGRFPVALCKSSPQWGDAIQSSLHYAGVTEARYSLFKKFIGLDPQCGCEYRREVLNYLGQLFDQRRQQSGLLAATAALPDLARQARRMAGNN